MYWEKMSITFVWPNKVNHACKCMKQILQFLPLDGGVVSTSIPEVVAVEQIWAPLQEINVT